MSYCLAGFPFVHYYSSFILKANFYIMLLYIELLAFEPDQVTPKVIRLRKKYLDANKRKMMKNKIMQ